MHSLRVNSNFKCGKYFYPIGCAGLIRTCPLSVWPINIQKMTDNAKRSCQHTYVQHNMKKRAVTVEIE